MCHVVGRRWKEAAAAGPTLAPWRPAARGAQDSSIEFTLYTRRLFLPADADTFALPTEYPQASAVGASSNHVSHQLPILRGEVP